jgi:hypothetical protein
VIFSSSDSIDTLLFFLERQAADREFRGGIVGASRCPVSIGKNKQPTENAMIRSTSLTNLSAIALPTPEFGYYYGSKD